MLRYILSSFHMHYSPAMDLGQRFTAGSIPAVIVCPISLFRECLGRRHEAGAAMEVEGVR